MESGSSDVCCLSIHFWLNCSFVNCCVQVFPRLITYACVRACRAPCVWYIRLHFFFLSSRNYPTEPFTIPELYKPSIDGFEPHKQFVDRRRGSTFWKGWSGRGLRTSLSQTECLNKLGKKHWIKQRSDPWIAFILIAWLLKMEKWSIRTEKTLDF